jgi:hypothetical protein
MVPRDQILLSFQFKFRKPHLFQILQKHRKANLSKKHETSHVYQNQPHHWWSDFISQSVAEALLDPLLKRLQEVDDPMERLEIIHSLKASVIFSYLPEMDIPNAIVFNVSEHSKDCDADEFLLASLLVVAFLLEAFNCW